VSAEALLRRALEPGPLDRGATRELFAAVLRGELATAQLVTLLVAMRERGEAPDEVAGAVEALRAACLPFASPGYDFADLVGTGGDGAGTINVSTAAAVVAAEAGLPIVKHGNRSASSRAGSADVLEACGVHVAMAPEVARRAVDELGLAFLFAPLYHPGLARAAEARRAVAARTIFNLLGPLVNPARPPLMLVGVYAPERCRLVAESLQRTGVRRAYVVHGGGTDEIALHADTTGFEVDGDALRTLTLGPGDFGAAPWPLERLRGGDPAANAASLRAVLSGAGEEPHRAAIAVNAAALLHVAGRAASLRAGYAAAREVLAAGRAWSRVERLAALSREEPGVGPR
jgi:anthranilate phosphoribosyltransferase